MAFGNPEPVLTAIIPSKIRLLQGPCQHHCSDWGSPGPPGPAEAPGCLRYSGRMPADGHKVASGAGIIVLCFFLSGATGLVYQVVWLRLLGLVFGHTVYATTTVLAAFMGGLALGSLLAARAMPRLRSLIAIYGWLEVGIGACCALLPIALENAPPLWVALSNGLG